MSDTEDTEVRVAAAEGAAAAVDAVVSEQDRRETEESMAIHTEVATGAASEAAEQADTRVGVPPLLTGGGIGCPLRRVDLLTVILTVVCYLASEVALTIRCGFGHPQVAPAADIRHPCQPSMRWSGRQIGREWAAKSLLNRESLGVRGSR